MLRIAIAIIIAYVCFVILIAVKQRSLMYFPLTHARPDIAKAPWMQWVEVTTQDGLPLKSWYSPPKAGMPTVAFFHGNANSIEARGPKALPFVQAGYGVLLAEYRGYGGNVGKPTEEGLYMDARAQLNWLLEQQSLQSDHLILYGESLGSGVAVQMAKEYKAKALILDVPFSSALDVAQSKFFFIPFLSSLMKDHYRSDQKIGAIDIPVLIGLGEKDKIIPARFGKKLFALANEPKTLKIYKNAGHMGIHHSGFSNDMLVFLEDIYKNSKDSPALEYNKTYEQ